jgi:hypothetical protein
VSDSEDEAGEGGEDGVHQPVQDLEVSWGCGSPTI